MKIDLNTKIITKNKINFFSVPLSIIILSETGKQMVKEMKIERTIQNVKCTKLTSFESKENRTLINNEPEV